MPYEIGLSPDGNFFVFKSRPDRVDMFALGATLLELCRGRPLPSQVR